MGLNILKISIFAFVKLRLNLTWNQPVLSNEGNVSCSRKQQGSNHD